MITPASFTNFGDLLKHLRLRAQLTQRELALAVGYNHAHLSRLESNQRIPDAATIEAVFVPALGLEDEPAWSARLIELAALGRDEAAPHTATTQPTPTPTQSPQAPSLIPIPFTSYLGRAEAIDAALTILKRPEVRLLTLIGPPGIGKTRLALQMAAQLTGQFTDGIFFVDLTSIRAEAMVTPAVARTLDVKESAARSLATSLMAALRSKTLLLILDNFEQVLAAAPLVNEWLRNAPRLKVLVTSREALHLSGEYEFTIPPLPADIQVELFVQRARAVQPNFKLDSENEAAIATICQHLDGLPLAIELAAARVKQFSAQAMLNRLDRRFQWLTGGARDGAAWRQTLRGAIDWSYNLLEADEQKAWARLVMFAGGFSLEAAERVSAAPLETLLTLADKSLIAPMPQGSQAEPRFTLLETLREYALERLAENPAALDDAANAHALYFLDLAEAAEPELNSAQPAQQMKQLEREHDNLRAALTWAIQHRPKLGVRLVLSLGRFWYLRGYFSESQHWQNAALSHADEWQRMALTRQLGEICWSLGEFSIARANLEESVALARAAQNQNALADALNLLGRVTKDMGSYEAALGYFEEGLALARAQANPAGLINLLRNLGNIHLDLGRMQDALRYFEESLALARRINDRVGIAGALNNSGIVYIALKDYARAKACFLEALPILQEDGFQFGTALAVVNIGRVAHAQGALLEAKTNFETSLRLAREIGKKWSIAYALSNLGLVACDLENYAESERYFREALQVSVEAAAPPRALDALGGYALLMTRTNRYEQAAELLGLVQNHPATEHEALERANALVPILQAELDLQVLNAARQRGAAADWEETARKLSNK